MELFGLKDENLITTSKTYILLGLPQKNILGLTLLTRPVYTKFHILWRIALLTPPIILLDPQIYEITFKVILEHRFQTHIILECKNQNNRFLFYF
jgi:hypothetical protein